MDKITKEIEALAEQMEKSVTDPNDRLFSIIKSLGKDGLKAKLEDLSDEEKVTLKATLEEMTLKKAISFDKEAQSVKFVRGKVTDTIIQEDKADDDVDETLVKPEAAKMDHQGTPTDGWQGQVIKSIEDSEELIQPDPATVRLHHIGEAQRQCERSQKSFAAGECRNVPALAREFVKDFQVQARRSALIVSACFASQRKAAAAHFF